MFDPMNTPVPYAADVEMREKNEDETIADLNRSFEYIVARTAEDYGHAVRGVHAKNHGEAIGTFTILDGLDPDYAQGLFAEPGEHAAILRFSTNPGDILDDSVSVPRGLAIKVLDAAGERLDGSEGETTQDFVMINGPVFSAPSAADFARTIGLLARTTDRAEGLKKIASAFLKTVEKGIEKAGFGGSATLQTLGGAPDTHPLGQTFYSQTPFRYGDAMAKFQLAPVAGSPAKLEGENVTIGGRADALREEMNEALREEGGEWEFRVQLCRDLKTMPIEDPSVPWDEEQSPFVAVARVRIPAQTAYEDDRNTRLDDEIRFSPWTGIAAHRPLGGVNRARRQPYETSSALRAKINGCPFHEPRSASDIPG